MTLHDMTLLTWTPWRCGNSNLLLMLSIGVLLGCDLSSPSYGLVMWTLQWYLILNGSYKLVSFCFLLIYTLVGLATRDYLRMIPSSFSSFIISPWLDSVPILVIQSWWENINLKNPSTKMMHSYRWTKFRTIHKLRKGAQILWIM